MITLVQSLAENDEPEIDSLGLKERRHPERTRQSQWERPYAKRSGSCVASEERQHREGRTESAINLDVLDDIEPLTAAGGQPRRDGACR